MALVRELGEQTEQDILEKMRQSVNDGFTRFDITNGYLDPQGEEEPPVLRVTMVAFNDSEA